PGPSLALAKSSNFETVVAIFIDGVQEPIRSARSSCRTGVESHCSRPRPGLESCPDVIRPRAGCCRSKTTLLCTSRSHGASKLRPRKKHPSCALPASVIRCVIGNCVNIEVERVED